MLLYGLEGLWYHHRPPIEENGNLGGKGHSRTLAVKGELVLLIMSSKFVVIFPFMAFLTSSNSFLMFFIT